MSNVLFLVAVVVLSAVGSFTWWLLNRRPQTMESGIRAFEQEMRALAPDEGPTERSRRGPQPQRGGVVVHRDDSAALRARPADEDESWRPPEREG